MPDSNADLDRATGDHLLGYLAALAGPGQYYASIRRTGTPSTAKAAEVAITVTGSKEIAPGGRRVDFTELVGRMIQNDDMVGVLTFASSTLTGRLFNTRLWYVTGGALNPATSRDACILLTGKPCPPSDVRGRYADAWPLPDLTRRKGQ